ncbi:MAG: hypothetical protein K9N23_08550 [Akkermansiaceae bacterium]|nr:hypothetical protein [Akkermansiaceae bacterium]
MDSTSAPAPQKKTRRRIPVEVWAELQRKAVAGIALQTLAQAFEIPLATVNDRSKRFGWKTPGRQAKRRAAAARSVAPPKPKPPVAANGGAGKGEQLAVPDGMAELEALADAPPEVFQKALVPVLQRRIVEALRAAPLPRTLSDVKTLADLHRRASGIEAKDWSGSVGFVNPIRTLTRRQTPVIEAVACDA